MEELIKLIAERCEMETVSIPIKLAVEIVVRLEKLNRIEELVKHD